jgi:very-short-patch-repair endonuclease
MRFGATDSEAGLFERVRGRRLGVAFRRQVPLLGRYIVDLLAPQLRLVVEVDGAYHRCGRPLMRGAIVRSSDSERGIACCGSRRSS